MNSPWHTALPTTAGLVGDMARSFSRAIGPAYQAADGTVAAADALAIGDSLALIHETQLAVAAEAFLDSAFYLLAEWETQLGLPVEPYLGVAARRRRLVARWRALRGGTPQAIVRAVTALLTVPDAAVVVENGVLDVLPEPENVHLFAVVVPLSYFSDPNFAPAARGVIEKAKPAHTAYRLTNHVGFYTDDPNSLTDLTVLGA